MPWYVCKCGWVVGGLIERATGRKGDQHTCRSSITPYSRTEAPARHAGAEDARDLHGFGHQEVQLLAAHLVRGSLRLIDQSIHWRADAHAWTSQTHTHTHTHTHKPHTNFIAAPPHNHRRPRTHLIVVPQALVALEHGLPHAGVLLLLQGLDRRERALVLRDDVAGAAGWWGGGFVVVVLWEGG